MVNQIDIRPMTQDDFQDGAHLMSYAFREKLQALKKLSQDEVADFMLAGGVFDKLNLSGHYVACIDSKIVGIINLDIKENQAKATKSSINATYLIRKYGLIRTLITGISSLFLNHSISDDEMMVDFIAVHPDFRGYGIGSNLLKFGEILAIKNPNIKKYSLYVIEKNQGAKRLYERIGFVVVKKQKQYISTIFTGVSSYYKMVKEVK